MTDTPKRMRSTAWAAVALALTTPIAIWGLLGQQDSPGFTPGELDYMVRPWNIPPVAEHAATIGAAVLLVLAAAHLIRAAMRGLVDVRWLTVLGPLLAAGTASALLQRAMTAGGIGANIGGAIAEYALIPFIGLMLVVAAAFSLYMWNVAGNARRPL
ncbi:hypothetical protein J5X84_33455 [Streptosporangiaceae bacterium NEAU-GS5]|nr:hypothetical protein [Streptosporangiaceae bacterium NEAU-GS5]